MSVQYISGVSFGWPDSVRVHVHAVIVGNEVEVGEHSRIDAFTVITGNVKIGKRCHIGHGAAIFGTHGVVMGDGCSLSPGAKIFTATDDAGYSLLSNPQLEQRAYRHGPVRVGDFASIGSNSVILPNAKIGSEVQIGALSCVKGNIPDSQVWGGIPAHYLFQRSPLDRAAMMGYEITGA